MSLLTQPELSLIKPDTTLPIELAVFDTLYVAIGKAVARNPTSIYKFDNYVDDCTLTKRDELELQKLSMLRSCTKGSEHYSLGVFCESNLIYRDLGIVAFIGLTDLSEMIDLDGPHLFVLTVDDKEHFITDGYTGRTINPDIIRPLAKVVNALNTNL